jgi:hypothetical protein
MFGKRVQDLDSMARAAWHDAVDHLSSSEAGRRAGTAWDVLAGRPVHTRTWPLLRAAAIGVVIGWVGSEVYRRSRTQIDEAVDRVGDELREARTTVDDRLARAKATPGTPIDKARAAMGTTGIGTTGMGPTYGS